VRRLSGFYVLSVLALILPTIFPDNYYLTVVGVFAAFHIILAVGLNLLIGYCGQISLGHAAFFGIGAYSSGILTTQFSFNPWLAILAGLVVVFFLANLIARPILKLKGHYLAMATLGFGIIIHIILVQTESLTGGPDGLGDIPGLMIGSWAIDSDLRWYYVSSVFALLTIWLSLNLIDSRPGRAIRAVHGSEFAAQMMGINSAKTKVSVFVFAALLACFAGSLFAHQQNFVSPDSFSFFFSIELVTMVVLGGMASTYGAVFGAILLTFLPELLVVFEDYEMLIFGAILMGVMIFIPQGLFVGLLKNRLVLKLLEQNRVVENPGVENKPIENKVVVNKPVQKLAGEKR